MAVESELVIDDVQGGANGDMNDNEIFTRPKSANLFVKILRTIHMIFFVGVILVITPLYAAMLLCAIVFSGRAARAIGRTWNQIVLFIGGVKLNVSGAENIDPNTRYVFMSNHQSALDIPIIYAGLGAHICFIAKKELFAIPVFGWCMKMMAHVSIDRESARKAHASMISAAENLRKNNVSLILFPEGTRSKSGKVLEFKTGAFNLALQTKVALVPVAIRNAIDRLPPKSSAIIPGAVSLEIGRPIDAATLAGMSKSEICAKMHETIKRMAER